MVEGLGRGIGATGAHELGHQRNFGFSRDVVCDSCYDSHTSESYVHFFGKKDWSKNAKDIMKGSATDRREIAQWLCGGDLRFETVYLPWGTQRLSPKTENPCDQGRSTEWDAVETDDHRSALEPLS